MKHPATSDPFWEQGFELLPPCLTDDELIGALEAIDEWMRKIAKVKFQFIMDITSDERFTRLIKNKIVHSRMEALLGSEPNIYYSHFIVSSPAIRKTVEVDDWHVDQDRKNLCIKAAFYLTDVSKEGHGNTYIQPGSIGHLANPKMPSIPILSMPGGVLLYRPRLWHSRSTNCSNIVRKVVFLSCQASI